MSSISIPTTRAMTPNNSSQQKRDPMSCLTTLNPCQLATGDQPGPTSRSYWVLEDQLAVGAYPGKKHSGIHEPVPEVITELLDADIDVFINLTQDYPGGSDEHLTRYDNFLTETVTVERFPIEDVSTPDIELMEEILDSIDTHLTKGRTVYIHCWGGIGRAGTTIGCWLIRHGHAKGDEVFDVLAELRKGNRDAGHRLSLIHI